VDSKMGVDHGLSSLSLQISWWFHHQKTPWPLLLHLLEVQAKTVRRIEAQNLDVLTFRVIVAKARGNLQEETYK